MNKNDVLPKLKRLKATSNGWSACCPAHDDNRRSLSVSEVDGKLLFNCFAGCSFQDIVAALGNSSNGNGQGKFVVVYNYKDENGKIALSKRAT